MGRKIQKLQSPLQSGQGQLPQLRSGQKQIFGQGKLVVDFDFRQMSMHSKSVAPIKMTLIVMKKFSSLSAIIFVFLF